MIWKLLNWKSPCLCSCRILVKGSSWGREIIKLYNMNPSLLESEIRAESQHSQSLCHLLLQFLDQVAGQSVSSLLCYLSSMSCLLHRGIWHSPNFTHSESEFITADLDWTIGRSPTRVVHWSIKFTKCKLRVGSV